MKYIKSFENKLIDDILDKISASGLDSLTKYEKEFLDRYSKYKPTDDVEKHLNSKYYEDTIGNHKVKVKMLDIYEPDGKMKSEIDAILYVDDTEYKGIFITTNNEYIGASFTRNELSHSNTNTDNLDEYDISIYDDLSDYLYDVDDFLENSFYDLIEK